MRREHGRAALALPRQDLPRQVLPRQASPQQSPLRALATVALLCAVVPAGAALAQEAPPDAAPPPAASPDAAPKEGTDLEFVDEGPSPFEANDDEPMDLPTQEAVDVKPPSIDDFAIAAGSPDAAVRVTAVVTDDASGIEAVEVFYRVGDEVREFSRVTLEAQTGGLFMGIFPDGPQRTGFAYYAEAKDAAGNVARLGDPEKPFKVAAPRQSGMATLEQARYEPVDEPLVAPVWIALALGAGVLAAAGGAIFLVDFGRLFLVTLPEETPGTQRHTLVQQLMIGDAVIGGILAVLGAAGIATGTGLLVVAALDE